MENKRQLYELSPEEKELEFSDLCNRLSKYLEQKTYRETVRPERIIDDGIPSWYLSWEVTKSQLIAQSAQFITLDERGEKIKPVILCSIDELASKEEPYLRVQLFNQDTSVHIKEFLDNYSKGRGLKPAGIIEMFDSRSWPIKITKRFTF